MCDDSRLLMWLDFESRARFSYKIFSEGSKRIDVLLSDTQPVLIGGKCGLLRSRMRGLRSLHCFQRGQPVHGGNRQCHYKAWGWLPGRVRASYRRYGSTDHSCHWNHRPAWVSVPHHAAHQRRNSSIDHRTNRRDRPGVRHCDECRHQAYSLVRTRRQSSGFVLGSDHLECR